MIRAAKQEKETEIDQLPLELAVIDFIGDDKEGVIPIEKEEPKHEEKKVEEIKIEKKTEEKEEVVVEDKVE